jgi:hypothetical protein
MGNCEKLKFSQIEEEKNEEHTTLFSSPLFPFPGTA